jgi:hypothetical protein
LTNAEEPAAEAGEMVVSLLLAAVELALKDLVVVVVLAVTSERMSA